MIRYRSISLYRNIISWFMNYPMYKNSLFVANKYLPELRQINTMPLVLIIKRTSKRCIKLLGINTATLYSQQLCHLG